ncbi:MAG: hypothetical protein J7L23_01455 [Candidatus Diapherotrites archaeon]|nr:hypothetical protein [Candidatus Diapherotrites archaeon]
MDKDEIAFKIVELYITQIADAQERRKMGLDTVMNAYFYALLRLTRKEKEMQAFEHAVTKEEKFLEAKENQEELPKMEESKKPDEKEEEFIFD